MDFSKMFKYLLVPTLVVGLLALWVSDFGGDLFLKKLSFTKSTQVAATKTPNEWLYTQRAYPFSQINYTVARKARQQAKHAHRLQKSMGEWELAGPTNVGGRVTDVALHPQDPSTIYVGCSAGGVFKTTDGGDTFQPIFDDQSSLSIGNIAMDPQDPETLYIGTGEANGSATSGSFFGDGIYKTTDGGNTWAHSGLSESNHIGRIVVDPTNSDRVFVAVAGQLYGQNEERGVFRSTDGGENWERVFFLSDYTACIDLVVNPVNPDIIYAAMWERVRFAWGRVYGGATSGIYRSTDGGDTWVQLTNGLPPSTDQTGRIGLAISASNPDVLYTSYTENPITNSFQGIYKTIDGGDTWTQTNDSGLSNLYASFGWFFGNIRVDPNDSNVVYAMGLDLYKSTDGGASWFYTTNGMHVDQHGLEIHPLNSNMVVAGNDGGLYLSQNGGSTWQHANQLPITQFYACEIDHLQPERKYGGTQDNGTNRTLTGSTDDWQHILGGDGFYVLVDPTDNTYVYGESQWGNFYRSTNGGYDFDWATFGIDDNDRTNWNTPVVFDPNNPEILFYGANRLYKSTNRAVFWEAISEDLTNGPHIQSASFGTITTIAVAPSNSDVIYVGTDDSNVQVTFDGGSTWQLISGDLPDRYISRVAVDPVDDLVAYVTISGYRQTDYLPHIFRTADGGSTWEDISGNLPEVPINDVIVDTEYNETLYIANDLGVWITEDLGGQWIPLGDNLPLVPVFDLDFHADTRTLVAATFGRSMHTIDLNEVVGLDKPNGVADSAPFQIYPNPIQSVATVEWTMQDDSQGTLAVYDLSGKQVDLLGDIFLKKGKNKVEWVVPAHLSSGNYIVRMVSEGAILSKQVVVR